MARQACRPQSRSFREQVISPDQDVPDSYNLPEVLLVEDGTGVFQEIGSILEEQGFLVLWAPDAPTALEEMANYQVDAVMVNATRTDSTGLQVLAQAKRLNHEVVTVVLSSGGGVDLPVAAFESEIDCYLGSLSYRPPKKDSILFLATTLAPSGAGHPDNNGQPIILTHMSRTDP